MLFILLFINKIKGKKRKEGHESMAEEKIENKPKRTYEIRERTTRTPRRNNPEGGKTTTRPYHRRTSEVAKARANKEENKSTKRVGTVEKLQQNQPKEKEEHKAIKIVPSLKHPN